MNSLKKPETIITLVNTAALLGISVYFYRKTNNLESELNKHSDHLTSTIKKVKEIANTKKYFAQIANAIKELKSYSDSYKSDIENLKEIIKYQNLQIAEMHTFILSLRPEDNKNDLKLKENPHIFSINPFHRQQFPGNMQQYPQQMNQPLQPAVAQQPFPQNNQGQMRQLANPPPPPQQFPQQNMFPQQNQFPQQTQHQNMNQFPQQNMNQFPQQNQNMNQFPQQNQNMAQFPQQNMNQNMNAQNQFPQQNMQNFGFPQQNNGFPQQNVNQNFGQQGMFQGMDGGIDDEDAAIAAVQRAKQQQATDNVSDNLF